MELAPSRSGRLMVEPASKRCGLNHNIVPSFGRKLTFIVNWSQRILVAANVRRIKEIQIRDRGDLIAATGRGTSHRDPPRMVVGPNAREERRFGQLSTIRDRAVVAGDGRRWIARNQRDDLRKRNGFPFSKPRYSVDGSLRRRPLGYGAPGVASQELSVISRRSGLLDAIRQRNRAEIIAKRRGEICRANLDQRDLAPVPEVAVRLRSHPPARRPNRSRTEPINLLGTQDGRDLDLIGLDGLRSWSAFKIGDEPRLNLQRKIENSGADFRARFSLLASACDNTLSRFGKGNPF